MKTDQVIPPVLKVPLPKLNSICRICLSENMDESLPLFANIKDTEPIYETLMLCARVTIRVEDGLPSIICKTCYDEFVQANNFRIKCEDSDAILQRYYVNISLPIVSNDVNDSKRTFNGTGKDSPLELLSVKNDVDDESPLLNECGSVRSINSSEYALELSQDTENGEHIKIEDECNVFNDETHNNSDEKTFKMQTSINTEKRASLFCTFCSKLLKSEASLIKHIKTRHKDRTDINEVSNVDFNILNTEKHSNDANEETLLQYCNINFKENSFICEVCKKPLKSKISLEKHIKSMHIKRTHTGRVTGHGSERRFHCTECVYSTRHSQSLVYHMRRHSGERPYKCDICDKSFSQPGSLSCHKKTHSDKMYFTCAECGKQFKYKDTYKLHRNVHIDEKKYTCTICNKGLKSRITLEGHMNRHYNIRNYSCETCGATFVTRVELMNHNKKHTGDKKYQCHLCEYKTFTKKSLQTHVRRHTGERPFKCDLCDVACYTNGELKCHKRKHTREKNYACPMCEQMFIHSSSVNKHMLKAHNIKYTRSNIDRRVIK